jgi:UDP:flavonoid glycosyltransferase YjiC (YdhE family)
LELGRRLAAARHRVSIAGDEATRDIAGHLGLEFLGLQPDRLDEFQREDAAVSWTRRLLTLRDRRARARQALGVDDLVELLRRLSPDLVLINGEMHAQIIVAVAAGVRVGLLNSFVSIWRCAGVPPPHHLAIPGVGWRGTSAGMRLLWTSLRLRKMRRRWWEIVQCVGCDRTSVLWDLAHDAGCDAKALDRSQWLIPFTYRDLPVLSLHAREFEFPHQPPAHVRYVGPMILASRPDRPMSADDRARLDGLLARRAGSVQRRLIYAAFGSAFSADTVFLRRLAQAVEQRPHWDLVLSLGGRTAPADVVLPPCVQAFEWLPQLEVLASRFSRTRMRRSHTAASTRSTSAWPPAYPC